MNDRYLFKAKKKIGESYRKKNNGYKGIYLITVFRRILDIL